MPLGDVFLEGFFHSVQGQDWVYTNHRPNHDHVTQAGQPDFLGNFIDRDQ